jgi:hypothetical protein
VTQAGDEYAHAEVFDPVATELWRATVGPQQQLAAMYGETVPDEQLGFRRVRLAMSYGADSLFG